MRERYAEKKERRKSAIRANVLWRREELQVHIKCKEEKKKKKRHATTLKTMRIEEKEASAAAIATVPAKETHKI